MKNLSFIVTIMISSIFMYQCKKSETQYSKGISEILLHEVSILSQTKTEQDCFVTLNCFVCNDTSFITITNTAKPPIIKNEFFFKGYVLQNQKYYVFFTMDSCFQLERIVKLDTLKKDLSFLHKYSVEKEPSGRIEEVKGHLFFLKGNSLIKLKEFYY